jgi:hypothetical protein
MTPRMRRRATILATAGVSIGAALLLLDTSLLRAVGSQTWRQREKADFEKGEPKGVSLSSDGSLRLSPKLDVLHETSQPYVWALGQDGKGTIYASGGNEGRIYRIPPSGKGEVFFRVDDPEVHALALDASGDLYAGTSPGGKVYKIAPDGKKVWVCATGEKYVWALAFDRQGGLYAGTGVEGRILKIDPAGKSRIFFDSAETHIRALVPDPDGNLIAGTDGHGLVLKIDPKGEGFVLYDAPLNEVASLVVAPGGTIYAAALGETGHGAPRGERPPSQPVPTPPPSPPQAEGGAPPPQATPEAQAAPPPEQRIPISMEGKVLAISRDGYAREIWSAAQEAILSLAPAPGGGLLMGSSSEGRIYNLGEDGEVAQIARVSSGQVTAMLRRGAKGSDADEVIIAGSNLGTVSLLRAAHSRSGTFESRVLDAHAFADWGRLAFRADLPKGTTVGLAVRSGNTEEPDRTWSDWGPVGTGREEGRLTAPSARLLQWRATLSTDDPARTPVLREVSVTYLQRNLPPEFRKIEVQPPGVSFQKIPAGQPGAQEGRPGPSDVEGGVRKKGKPQSRRGFDPGARSVTWQVNDPNDDDLAYTVYYRGIDEKAWKQIRKEIDEDYVTLDTTAMPDGTYIVRVVASDAPSNPLGQALTAEKTSGYFDVDNTPPRVEGIKAAVQGSTVRLSFTASDTFSIVREVSYAVDAGDWVAVRPASGLNDSLSEPYAVTVQSLAPEEHSIVVRATDAAGNVGAGKTVVEIR